MPTLDVEAQIRALGGDKPLPSGQITLKYLQAPGRPAATLAGAEVTFSPVVTARITDGALHEPLAVPATDEHCYAELSIEAFPGGTYSTGPVRIPPDATTLADLVPVDPATFEPLPAVPPTAQELIAEAGSAVTEATAQSATASQHAHAAAGSAAAAAGSADAAAGSASDASGYAGVAAGSAGDAAGYAASAADAASDAAGSATAADGSATAAGAARSGAEDARAGAETAQEEAERARDETVVAVPTPVAWAGAVSLTQAQTRSTYLRRTLTGNVVLTLAAGVADRAYSCTLQLTQDATGGRMVTFANVATAFGVPIPLSTAVNAVDVIRLEWNGAVWRAYLAGQQFVIPTSWVV